MSEHTLIFFHKTLIALILHGSNSFSKLSSCSSSSVLNIITLSALHTTPNTFSWICCKHFVQIQLYSFRTNGKRFYLYRLCGVPKCADIPIKKTIRRQQYLLPVLEDNQSKLEHAMPFPKVNLDSAFWQLELNSKSILILFINNCVIAL